MVDAILASFGVEEETALVEAFGTGLINRTWKVTTPNTEYILQKVNDQVFQKPAAIVKNIRHLENYLHRHYPDYCFAAPLVSRCGDELVYGEGGGVYRMFPFISNSHSVDVLETPEQAYEAARQFGRFTRLLAGFDATKLNITIPHFHDLTLRYTQFVAATKEGNPARIAQSHDLIEELCSHKPIVDAYERIKTNPDFRLRVTHHDTKISNVLFDANNKGLCVIDLDTVMPGYYISDVGDMMRTYLSPVSEEETDFALIAVREDYVKAIADGYLSEMGEELSAAERCSFLFAGKFLIYMQALRFLTDHLYNDVYYGARYEGHNLARARNQAVLLQRLMEKEDLLKTYINLGQ